ncbi:MAG: sulfurtransferase TusA family protein [Rhodospirillaceae bacterium]
MIKPEPRAPEDRPFIDITGDICPMTFVKTKLFIERLQPGDVLEVRLKGVEPLDNVPRSVRDHGHEVISLTPEPGGDGLDQPHRLIIRKS